MRLLGEVVVDVDGTRVEPPSGRRAWALLAWLLLHPGVHPRSVVASVFWPDVLDSSARASLRSALWALRQALGAEADLALVLDRDVVGTRPGAHVELDAARVDDLVGQGRLDEAVAADGVLMPGFDDEWVVEQREQRRLRTMEMLEELARAALARHDLDAAIGWTRRQCAADPHDDGAARRLMARLDEAGDRSGALQAFQGFERRLRVDLGIDPSPQTQRLAHALRGSATPRLRPRPGTAAMVGRSKELDELGDLWRQVRTSGLAVAVVGGEPGIGKTRLAQELVTRVRTDGGLVAACDCLDLGGAAPLAPWAELVSTLAEAVEPPPAGEGWPQVLGAVAPGVERKLGVAPGPPLRGAPDLERVRLFEAVVSLVGWASRAPVLLVVDDAHAADVSSLDLLGHVCRRLAARPVMVLLTRRTDPRRPSLDALVQSLRGRGLVRAELDLAPLGADDLASLAQTVAPLSGDRLGRAVEAADGNPLLVIEWASALARGEPEVPAGLLGLVRGLLDHLDDEGLSLARLIAVAGREVTRDEIAQLPLTKPLEATVALADSSLFEVREGRVRYRHALLRDAAYSDVPDPVRVALHEALGRILARQGGASSAEAAEHLVRAGRAAEAAAALRAAAVHARGLAALAEAVAYLRRAVELVPDDPLLVLDLAELEAWCARAPESDRAFDEALRLGVDAHTAAEAWVRRSTWYRGALCHPARVLTAARTAVAVLDESGIRADQLRVDALAQWAWAEAVAGELEVAERLLDDVADLVGQGGGDVVEPSVGHARAFILVRRGRFRESYAPQLEAAEASRRLGRPDLGYGAWANAACAATCAGEFDRALEFVDRGLAALEDTGFDPLRVHLLAGRSHLLVRLGRVEEAREAARGEEELAARLEDVGMAGTASHDTGMLALALGEYDRAVLLLRKALELAAPMSVPQTRLALAEALVRLDRFDEAQAELRRTALAPTRPGDLPETLVPRLTWLQGLIAAGRGDQDLARRRLTEAATGWRRLSGTSTAGEGFVATLADFGRPPVLGLVEPARELDRVLADLATLGPEEG